MATKVEKVALLLLAAISGLVSILHLLGLLEHEGILHKVPTLTLLCVAVVVASLVLQQSTKLDSIKKTAESFAQQQEGAISKVEKSVEHGVERIIRSLGGIEVTIFPQPKDLYRYVIRRMREASNCIDDLTWGLSERERTPESQAAYEEYVETIKVVCAKGSVAYREVMSFPAANHFDRADAMLRQGKSSYHLRYYEVSCEHTPPLISFIVIDLEEVILAFYRSGLLPAEKEIRVAVRHPDIVKLFADYYDAIWQGASPLEGAQVVTASALQEIRKRFPESLEERDA